MYGILAVLCALLIAIFSVQNAAPVDIKFLTWQFENISLVLVILFSAVFGGLLVFFGSIFKIFSISQELRNLKKEKILLEEDYQRVMEMSTTKDNC